MKSIKPTILIFIDWFEPGFRAGGPIRSVANMVSFLSSQYNFKLVTRDTDYTETIPYPNIETDVWLRINSSTEIYYISASNLKLRTIEKILSNTQRDFVYLNSMYSVYFSLAPLWFNKNNTKVVLAPRGMLSPGSLRVKSFKKKLFLKLFKLSGRLKKVIFQVTSTSELSDVQSVFSKNEIFNASNFPSNITEAPVKNITPIPLKLINIGRISPEKNNLFAIEILKDLNFPVVLDFYGPINDREYYEKCVELSQSISNVKINFRGVIRPNQIAQTLKDYHFFLSPSTGENYGHSIVESLLNSTPVIISDKTPWKDLKIANSGFDLPLETQIFKETLMTIPELIKSEKINKMRNDSRKYILKKINIPGLVEQYCKLFS